MTFHHSTLKTEYGKGCTLGIERAKKDRHTFLYVYFFCSIIKKNKWEGKAIVSEVIITACITGGLALLGNIFASYAGIRRIESELDKHNAVQDEQIKDLTREVRKHNGFAERIPRMEQQIEDLTRWKERMESK